MCEIEHEEMVVALRDVTERLNVRQAQSVNPSDSYAVQRARAILAKTNVPPVVKEN